MRSIFLNKTVIIQFLLISLFIVGTHFNCLGQSQTPTILVSDALSKSATKNFLNQLNQIYSGDLAKIKCRSSKKNQKIIEKKVESLLQAQKNLDIVFLSNVKNSKLDSTIKSTIEKNFLIIRYFNSREKKIEKIDKNLHYVISLLENSLYVDSIDYVIKTNYRYLSLDTINRSLKSKSQDLFINYKEIVVTSDVSYICDLHAILDNNTLTFNSDSLGESKEIINGTNRNLERLFSDFYQIKDNTKDDSKSLLEGPIELTLFNGKSNKFIRHYYNRRWRTYNRPNRLTAGFSTGYNINTGFLTPVDYSEETQVNLDNRLSNVKGLGTDAFSITIGYSKWSHSVEFSYRNTRFGFSTIESQNIDWTTGYATNISGTGPSIYSFRCNQLGLQYRYSNYYQKVSPYFAAGLNAAWTTRKINNIPSQENTYFGAYLNLGLGINIHPAYCWDIHIAPITNLFLNSKQGTKINTRFASVGIEIGVRFNIPLGLKQYI